MACTSAPRQLQVRSASSLPLHTSNKKTTSSAAVGSGNKEANVEELQDRTAKSKYHSFDPSESIDAGHCVFLQRKRGDLYFHFEESSLTFEDGETFIGAQARDARPDTACPLCSYRVAAPSSMFRFPTTSLNHSGTSDHLVGSLRRRISRRVGVSQRKYLPFVDEMHTTVLRRGMLLFLLLLFQVGVHSCDLTGESRPKSDRDRSSVFLVFLIPDECLIAFRVDRGDDNLSFDRRLGWRQEKRDIHRTGRRRPESIFRSIRVGAAPNRCPMTQN